MKNINRTTIKYGLKTLTIIAFVFLFVPFSKASAYTNGCSEGGCNIVYGAPYQTMNEGYTLPYQQIPDYNYNYYHPYQYQGSQTYPTYYNYDYCQPTYYGAPCYYPNAPQNNVIVKRVVVKDVIDPPAQTNTNINPATPTTPVAPSTTTPTTNNSASDLASNAIFGSNGFLPSGLIQWIFFAIIILLIVILVRKVFGTRDEYLMTPLKHE